VEHIGAAPEIDADRVADRDEIEAGLVCNARNLIVPSNKADALLPLPLSALQVGNCDLAVHRRACPEGSGSTTKLQDAQTGLGRDQLGRARALVTIARLARTLDSLPFDLWLTASFGFVEGHRGANESFQGLFVDLVAFVEVDGAPRISLEARV